MNREVCIETPVNLKARRKRLADATGVSERSVRQIINELDSTESRTSVSFSTSQNRRTRKFVNDYWTLSTNL
jgi:hypothetical protein